MKKLKLLLLPVLTAGLLAGCGGDDDGGKGNKEPYSLQTIAGLDEDYIPNLEAVDQTLEGEITVSLDFEGREIGWEACAREYEKMHNGNISVNIYSEAGGTGYSDKLKNEANKDKPTWNIVQGNLMLGLPKENELYAIDAFIYDENPYANVDQWLEVLDEMAYAAPKNGTSYQFNSENLQTAWFVNKVAMNKAVLQGYNGGVAKNPQTWDELVELCRCMKLAGYNNPLGLSLNTDSIKQTQFSWLLRVYGDYYYRDLYEIISSNPNWHFDGNAKNPEKNLARFDTNFFNTILNDGGEHYQGAKSERFKDFAMQFYKLKDYVAKDAYLQNFDSVRNSFQTQKDSTAANAPQIFLDYLGNGLLYQSKKNSAFDVDFFDNPVMDIDDNVSTTNRILRDVGGNGGYLSVLRTLDTNAKNISVDFLKFFLSPYGQSIYYAALKNASSPMFPKGITLVNETVIPDEWKEFFESDKVSFTGLADNNEYITYLIRGMGASTTSTNTNNIIATIWSQLCLGEIAPSIDANKPDAKYFQKDFAQAWHNALMADWALLKNSKGYTDDYISDSFWDRTVS